MIDDFDFEYVDEFLDEFLEMQQQSGDSLTVDDFIESMNIPLDKLLEDLTNNVK